MTDAEILHDLLCSKVCACTATKKRRRSLCPGCYGRLPEGLRRALFDRDEYPATYRRALAALGFPENQKPETNK